MDTSIMCFFYAVPMKTLPFYICYPADRFVLVDLADLEIKRVEPDDEGVYVCSVLSGDKTFNRHVVLLKSK